jgi:tRNA-Thr(GGU) m(6)t(6)A37 methyltransferase TsaA
MAPTQKEHIGPFIVIGRIHTPFKESQAIPIQGTANDARGTVAILPEYAQGLRDLDGFDRIWLIYVASEPDPVEQIIVPKLSAQTRGVFATRSLRHPNHIGLTCVKLMRVEGCTVSVEGVDMLDGTALLDLKPYVPRYDSYANAWAGWLENAIPHEEAWQDQRASR